MHSPFLKSVAGSFANAPETVSNDDGSEEIVWERAGLTAGAGEMEEDRWVFLADASHAVSSTREAVAILKSIFADETVAVAAFDKGMMVFCDLAPSNDPSAGFTGLDGLAAGDMPQIDEVRVRSWSGALDT